MTDLLHGLVYLLPGAFWLALAAGLWRAVPAGARAPLWARRHLVVSTTVLTITGVALLALGGHLAWAVVFAGPAGCR